MTHSKERILESKLIQINELVNEEKGKLLLTEGFQPINIEGMLELENHLWQPHSNTCFGQVWSSDAKIGEQVCDEKRNIYAVLGTFSQDT